MEFKRFKRKGIVFKNNSIGLGLEVTIKKNKVFQVERLTKNYNDFDYIIYNGHDLIDASLKKEIVDFLRLMTLNTLSLVEN